MRVRLRSGACAEEGCIALARTAPLYPVLVVAASTALLVVNLSVDNGTGALVAATTAIEETISTSFGVGRALLGTALGIISKLDGFYASLAAEVDVAKLLERLTCTEALLAPGGHLCASVWEDRVPLMELGGRCMAAALAQAVAAAEAEGRWRE